MKNTDSNKQVSTDGNIDLYSNCILGSTSKLLNLEVLL